MNGKIRLHIYLLVIILLFLTTLGSNQIVTVLSENAPITGRKCVIIDAGHGGVDGGATSCTGVLESNINLEIAMRLNDLMHLLGMETKMIRTTDCSVYTEDGSIAQKKVSDLKERVRIANTTENAIIISIHQNYFSQNQYAGAQVFYNEIQGSKELASIMQQELNANTNSKRSVKKAAGVYLMEKIQCTGILIECGFLSNPQEEALLRNPDYQKKLSSVIACTLSQYIQKDTVT